MGVSRNVLISLDKGWMSNLDVVRVFVPVGRLGRHWEVRFGCVEASTRYDSEEGL